MAPAGKVYMYKDYSYHGDMYEMDVLANNDVDIARFVCSGCIKSLKVGPGVVLKICH
jgi:hypothetical protein